MCWVLYSSLSYNEKGMIELILNHNIISFSLKFPIVSTQSESFRNNLPNIGLKISMLQNEYLNNTRSVVRRIQFAKPRCNDTTVYIASTQGDKFLTWTLSINSSLLQINNPMAQTLLLIGWSMRPRLFVWVKTRVHCPAWLAAHKHILHTRPCDNPPLQKWHMWITCEVPKTHVIFHMWNTCA